MKILRWIAVLPAGIFSALLVMFPIHWLIGLMYYGEKPFLGLLSADTLERLIIAFTTPFFAILAGAWTAPERRVETGVVLAIITALILGGTYVYTFIGGSQYSGWASLHFGATPLLNLVAIATALYTVRRNWGSGSNRSAS
jgi:hypothetical protein